MDRKIELQDYEHFYKHHNMFTKLTYKVALPLTLIVLALAKFGS